MLQLVAVYTISCLGSLLGGLLVLAAPLTRLEWLELTSSTPNARPHSASVNLIDYSGPKKLPHTGKTPTNPLLISSKHRLVLPADTFTSVP